MRKILNKLLPLKTYNCRFVIVVQGVPSSGTFNVPVVARSKVQARKLAKAQVEIAVDGIHVKK
jgi:hypothetical protein